MLEELNCNTNSTRNVRLTDGTLVLAAVHEKHLKSEFTSPLIKSKRSFKYGKFEIRAALPEGKLLRPYVYLESTVKSRVNTNVSNKKERIDILSNTQFQDFSYGMYFALNNDQANVTGKFVLPSDESVFKFHTYAMEWTETEIRWLFDDNPLFTANIQKELYLYKTVKYGELLRNPQNINPFENEFKLVISLGVGGKGYFPGLQLTGEEAENWPCSLLILDYIRVYNLTDEQNIQYDQEQNNITSNEICKRIMPLFRKNNLDQTSSPVFTALLSVSSLLLLLALIPLNIYLFIRFKKSRKTPRDSGLQDSNEYPELYDEGYDMNYIYDNGYDVYDQVHFEKDVGKEPEQKPIIYDRYMIMTNKTCQDATYV